MTVNLKDISASKVYDTTVKSTHKKREMTTEKTPKVLRKNMVLYFLFLIHSLNKSYMVISGMNPALSGEKMKPKHFSVVEKRQFQ